MSSIKVLYSRPEGLAVTLALNPNAWEPTPDIAEHPLYQLRMQMCLEAEAKGLLFNGPSLIPQGVTPSKKGDHQYVITGAPSKYYVSRAYGDYLCNAREEHDASSIGSDSVVITSDGLLLGGVRGNKVAKWASLEFLGFGEGVEPSDKGDLRAVAIRCLQEELHAPKFNVSNVKIVAIGVELEFYSLAVFSIVDLRGKGPAFSAKALLAGAARAHDNWEAQELKAYSWEQAKELVARGNCTPGTTLLIECLAQQPGFH